MDYEKREAIIDKRRHDLVASYETYLARLEELAIKRGMDLDVMSDIVPGLLTQSSESQTALSLLDLLYKNIAAGHTSVALTRIDIGLHPDIFTTGRREPPKTVLSTYIRVFENVTAEDITYIKAEDGMSRVAIVKPHTLLEIHHNQNDVTATNESSADILVQTLPAYSTSLPHTPELLLPYTIRGGDDLTRIAFQSLEQTGASRVSPQVGLAILRWQAENRVKTEQKKE